MAYSTLPADHFQGGANIQRGRGDGLDLASLLNTLNEDMLAVARSADPKDSVKAATAAAGLTHSGPQTVDGIACVAGDRVLDKDNATGALRGIWIVAAGAWTRALDMAAGADAAGAIMQVEQGSANVDKIFQCSNNKGSAVVGTDSLTFADVSAVMSHELMLGLLGGGVAEHYHIGAAQRGFFVAKAASVGNLTLSAPQTIDDIVCTAGNVVLVKNQSAPAENGVYAVAAAAWTRVAGLAAAASASGCLVHVDQGTLGANTNWQCTSVIGSDVVGTDSLTFVDVSTLGSHAAATAVGGHAGGAGDHTHQSTGAQGGKLDHGAALDGLLDDDHTQYMKEASLYSASDGVRGVHEVRAASTGNLALTGEQTIDTVACVAGDRVLCKNQTAPTENGIYRVAAGAWARAADMAAAATVAGALVHVSEGSAANLDRTYICTDNAGADVVDTHALTFVDASTLGAHAAGTAMAQHTAGMGDHTHATTGAEGGQLAVADALVAGAAHDVVKTNAAGTALEHGKIASANLANPMSRISEVVEPKDIAAGGGAITKIVEFPYDVTIDSGTPTDQIAASCSALGAGGGTVDIQIPVTGSILTAPITLVAASVVDGAVTGGAITIPAGTPISVIATCVNSMADVAVTISGRAAANLATANGRVPLVVNPKDGAPTVLVEVPYDLTVDLVNISCSGLGGGAPTVDVLDDGASILPGGAPVALVAGAVVNIAIPTPAVVAGGSVISVVIAAGGGAAADPVIAINGTAPLV